MNTSPAPTPEPETPQMRRELQEAEYQAEIVPQSEQDQFNEKTLDQFQAILDRELARQRKA